MRLVTLHFDQVPELEDILEGKFEDKEKQYPQTELLRLNWELDWHIKNEGFSKDEEIINLGRWYNLLPGEVRVAILAIFLETLANHKITYRDLELFSRQIGKTTEVP